MQIVKCSTKDITLLAAMNKCLIEDEQSSNTMNLKELEKRMSVFLSGEYDAYFFADDTLEASDKIFGYALVRNTASPLYLRQFYIKKEYRRKHLGSEAFKLLLDYLKADTIDIDVLPWNKSGMAFWKSMGFAEICVSMRYGEKTKIKKLGCRGSA